eukprot:CAMPEP_0169288200 /NCGR_PEP_ID=MMETSP1016-20121227/60410_1 /TAXON_ID=342587 /ORGANISM="Karlodinium micrum, Strain CCMP2283" /LENGTH=68 /DNA_ID=CAMNT_0009378369 /DNA_START=266 /DNA_END=469 /DNA_ORIENTATION=+
MVCGRDYHGGGQQRGCGTHFVFSQAPAYHAVRPRPQRVGDVTCVEPERVAETPHYFLDDQPWHCAVCS